MELSIKVKETVGKYAMLSEGDCVLIGLSGGPDSVCLAVILDKLKADFNLSLHAVYVDHGLRPDEAVAEKEFCGDLCKRLGINFFCETVDVKKYKKDNGLNTQEAARGLRYRVFGDIAGDINASRIALGHNADDRAETFLINLFRGSGRKGLTGIPPVRGLESRVKIQDSRFKKNILIIRPLIEIERREIEEFLTEQFKIKNSNFNIPFVIDSSNLKKDYFRNWIRLSFLSELKNRNPALVRNMCRTMDILKEEDDYLEIIVTKTLMKLITGKTAGAIELFLVPLETMERPVLRRVLRRAIDETEGLGGISFTHIWDIIDLVKSGKSGDRIYLPKEIRVIKSYSTLKITSGPPVRIGSHSLDVPGELALKEAGVYLKASLEGVTDDHSDGKTGAIFDAGKMGFPLAVRARREGDFFYPSGSGGRKKLQDFFVDEKVPRDERDSVPVVLSGDDIVWVAGYRADERFRVTGKTEKVLRLKITKR
ncbi:MAG: tRNA lysidine(34) synthetase TilS [Nitrospiraceae bacterium]|nr:MAG: tRNA lysidine(34) synthetase TilS [Nitrospiraceae bacterium]